MKQRILTVLLLTTFILPLQARDCVSCHQTDQSDFLAKSAGIFQKAVGVLDKGELQVNTGNFGTLGSFHVYFTNAAHWPSGAAYERQYLFGLGFMVGIDENNVIETETQSRSKIQDWLPPNDARGEEFSGEVVAASDQTPFMASSDLTQTWPDMGWPGYFRVDVNSLTPEQLAAHPNAADLPEALNQFSSDRDVFATYNDAENPMGSQGLTVEQTAHSYGRPYAEDMVFWDIKLFNDGGSDLNDIYVGFYVKFRPDFDNHDYLNFIDSDGDGVKDLVYVYDINNTLDGAWHETDDPLGIPALRIFDTPGQIGITDFHHFNREASPSTDQEMWAIMTSDPTSEHLVDPRYYFHGVDTRLDYTGTDSLEHYYPPFSDAGEPARVGNGVNFVLSCGPFDLQADSMVSISLGMIMGDAGTTPDLPDTTDLMNNVRTANEMYRLYFQGSGPPDPPTVHAVPGDGQVTLYWDAASEASRDVWTGEQDFEGYRIYRSTDAGNTWGKPITDIYGNQVGYHPLAQFDYSEEEDLERFGFDVSGPDPAFPQNLGDNTGLQHTFVDSNLINGVEYWYSVSAYDRGDQTDLANPVQSYMNAPGQSWYEVHTVRVTPGKTALDLTQGTLEPLGGQCDGVVTAEVEDPELLKNRNYLITFDVLDTLINEEEIEATFASILDEDTGDTLVSRQRIIGGSDENTISIDGLVFYLESPSKGVASMGWTRVAGDTCTFDWRVHSKYPNLVPSGQAVGDVVESFDNWRITVDYETGFEAQWYDFFAGEFSDQTQHLPLQFEVISDLENPVNVNENAILMEFSINAPAEFREMFYSPTGWDLVPGGLGYLSGSGGWREKHVDMLVMEKIDIDPATGDTIPNYIYLLTNNKPDTSINLNHETEIIDAVAPSQGDQFTIITNKPFRPEISYRYNPLEANLTSARDDYDPLENVYVVPDPYVVTNAWEVNEFGKKLMFTNLPSQCVIKIYTLAGEFVDELSHGDGSQTSSGQAFWDMRTRNDQFIAPGVYLYHVETPEGHETLGRFLVIK
jgi:hypothetical protein